MRIKEGARIDMAGLMKPFLRGGLILLVLALLLPGCHSVHEGGSSADGIGVIPADEIDAIASGGKVTLIDDSAAAIYQVPKNTDAMRAKIAPWLRALRPYTGDVPQTAGPVVFNANISPSRLILSTADGHTLTVCPAFYLVSAGPLSYTKKFVPDVLLLENDGEKSYGTSPALYEWLKNDKWKTDFEPMTP